MKTQEKLNALIASIIESSTGSTTFVLHQPEGEHWLETGIIICPKIPRAFLRFDTAEWGPNYYEAPWDRALHHICQAADGAEYGWKTVHELKHEYHDCQMSAVWLDRAFEASTRVDPRNEESIQNALFHLNIGKTVPSASVPEQTAEGDALPSNQKHVAGA